MRPQSLQHDCAVHSNFAYHNGSTDSPNIYIQKTFDSAPPVGPESEPHGLRKMGTKMDPQVLHQTIGMFFEDTKKGVQNGPPFLDTVGPFPTFGTCKS